jgi:hypothetical protein
MEGVARKRVKVMVKRNLAAADDDGAAEGLGLVQHMGGLGPGVGSPQIAEEPTHLQPEHIGHLLRRASQEGAAVTPPGALEVH